MKDKLLHLLYENTMKYGAKANDSYTALCMANELDLSRNAVSQYLNEFVQEGKAVKVNSRPVYFFNTEALEEKGIAVSKSIYNSIEDMTHRSTDFDTMIGANGSLFHVVERCKAAVCYPPNGLPVLLHGPTGTGKSMIARLMYEYGINKGCIEKNKQLVVLNCSEYANNPELLTANLFGCRKGAYTGADQDNAGLIQLADGGLLFLDEVQSLKAECQEKLFLFMDKGVYHRLGDNEHWYHSSCRIVFATTAKPEDVLLKTLLRRIPVSIDIPSLQQRGREEKHDLLSSIFRRESKTIGKSISISYLAYQVLMDTEIPGNVGGLINAVKATCATTFMNHSKGDSLQVYSYDLPDYILQLAPTINVKLQDKDDIRMMNLTFPVQSNPYQSRLVILYQKILDAYQDYENDPLNHELFTSEIMETIENYDDYINYGRQAQLKNLNNDFTFKITDKIFSIIMNKYSLKISNNDLVMVARYLSEYVRSFDEIQNWIITHSSEVHALNEIVQMKYPREYAIADEIAESIHLNLDIAIDDMMKIRLMLMLEDFDKEASPDWNTAAVILCHGYSTASSIATAVNKMLGQNLYGAIDMQLDISLDKVIVQLNDYLKIKHGFNRLVLLVDMGSLEEIYKGIKVESNVVVGIVNNINTKLALAIGSSILQGDALEETLQKTVAQNISQYRYIDNGVRSKAILSVCATGMGSAEKILDLFVKSLPVKIDAEIVTYDYQKLIENGGKDSIFDKYNVAFVIGTMDPHLDGVQFIPIEDLVLSTSMDEISGLMQQFLKPEDLEVFKANILKNFTLNNIVNNLTILNAEKVLDDVQEVVAKIEEGMDIQLNPANKMGLYVHMACLIERLILRNEIVLNQDPDEFAASHQKFIQVVRDAFSVVKYAYSVEIPDSEILYIYNYIQK